MSNEMRYVVWGSAGHAKVLADLIGLRGGRVIALFDNNPHAPSCLPGVPVFHGMAGFKAWRASQDSLEGTYAALAIGGMHGQDRQALAQQLRTQGLTLPSLVHPTATMSGTAQLGEGSQILAHAVVAADASIGEVCIINNSANVDHECHLSNGVHIAPGAILCGCISVGENAMIGAGAVILPRLKIGKGAIIGAGAVVTHDVPDGATAVGHPARIQGHQRND